MGIPRLCLEDKVVAEAQIYECVRTVQSKKQDGIETSHVRSQHRHDVDLLGVVIH